MSEQLALLDQRLQAELARPPHWAEPPSRIRGTRLPPKADYRAWLDHVAGCSDCALARDDLLALRRGELESEPAVPCPVGLRLLPLENIDLAAGGIDRAGAHEMLRRLIDHARELDGWGPESRMNPGQAWGREG